MDFTLDIAETRLLRRLARLIRFEREGRFGRCPPATLRRLLDRRGALVERVIALDDRRGSIFAPRTAALDDALALLAREVTLATPVAEARVAQLSEELRARRGGGTSGLRGLAGGRLLGSG